MSGLFPPATTRDMSGRQTCCILDMEDYSIPDGLCPHLIKKKIKTAMLDSGYRGKVEVWVCVAENTWSDELRDKFESHGIPQFHMKFDGCQGVLINEIQISSPKLSPNTDGIHLGNTRSVGIYNSVVSNGDDCISIGTGCSDVDIQGVTCGPSHGISIGSLGVHNSQACVSNITVRNTVIRDSDNGLRVKTWQGGTGSVSNLLFENIQMENVLNCIIVDQYYCQSKDCRNETSAVKVFDVEYRNIKGTYDVRSPPIHFACSDTVACTNITMSEVELLPEEGELVDDPFCWNAYGTQETLTIPPIDCLLGGSPVVEEAFDSNYSC